MHVKYIYPYLIRNTVACCSLSHMYRVSKVRLYVASLGMYRISKVSLYVAKLNYVSCF